MFDVKKRSPAGRLRYGRFKWRIPEKSLTAEPYEVETLKYGSKGRKLTPPIRPGEQPFRQGILKFAEAWFDQAAEYWKQAIALTPGNYIEAIIGLKITRDVSK
ncbi:hypothetical protein CTI12_AA359520 [Artemisia annua]|uniref:Uncharacterized protein n=1 Tax=Artemisia annua TaxID=35608 RepID=A0A2U1MNB6_ARTAN|nr:hypothetical protein CTI12_AA359520 [Artemisia annua]